MSALALDSIITPQPVGPGRFRCVFPEGWKQGRGLFGGLPAALMVRALEMEAPGRALRSLTCELCGPLQPGVEVNVAVETLRAGNAVTTCAVRLEQGGEVQAHGVGVLGKPRPGGFERVFASAPERPDWRPLEPLPVEPPLGPEFGPHFEFRATRSLPLSGETEPRTEGWVRLKNPGPTRDAALLACCVDAWWPTLFTIEETLRPMATISFTFQPFVRFEGLDPGSPLFFRGRLEAASEGYCVEFRELWGEDGRLLALNQQTMVMFK